VPLKIIEKQLFLFRENSSVPLKGIEKELVSSKKKNPFSIEKNPPIS